MLTSRVILRRSAGYGVLLFLPLRWTLLQRRDRGLAARGGRNP